MTRLPVIPDIVPTADNTTFESWERCPRLYWLRHVRGLSSKGVKTALGFGGMVHAGLAKWYETGSAEQALRTVEEYVFVDPESDHRTKGRAMVTMAEYIGHYGSPDSRWDKVLLTETPFDIVDADGFRYGGVIDLVVLWKGVPWIVDHKTTTRGGDSYWYQFQNSGQMCGYTWAGSELVGQPVRGVIINRILLHKQKKSPEEEFAWRPMLYSAEKVLEWKEMRIDAYHEIALSIETDNFRPRWDNCINKYGTCPFFNVCSAPATSREELIASDFDVRPWDWRDREEGEE